MEAVSANEKKDSEIVQVVDDEPNCDSKDTATAKALNSMMEVFREKEGILALNRSMKAENKALKKENATLRLQLHAHANLETS